MKAGAGKAVITPPLPVQLAGHQGSRTATAVADHLWARAVVFEDAGERVAVVACDLLWLDREQCWGVREEVGRVTGIPHHNVMVTCTHTHSGPDTLDWYDFAPPIDLNWLRTLYRQIATSVYIANQRMADVIASYHECEVLIGVNRRLPMNGTIERLPNPSGPVDRRCTALQIRGRDGSVVAVLFMHHTHPVILGPESTLVSGDWCGIASRQIERAFRTICLYLNGSSGDVNPVVGVGRPYAIARRVGHEVAGEVGLALRAAGTPVRLTPVSTQSEHLTADAFLHPYLTRAQERRVRRDGGMAVELQQVRLGEVAIMGLPGEILVETARAILPPSQNRKVLLVSGANDYVGYLPLQSAINEGGYEARTRMLSGSSIASCLDRCRALLSE